MLTNPNAETCGLSNAAKKGLRFVKRTNDYIDGELIPPISGERAYHPDMPIEKL